MSEESHEIIHIDTLSRIVAALEAAKVAQPVVPQSTDVARAKKIATIAQQFENEVLHLGCQVYLNDLIWALRVLAAAPAPVVPQSLHKPNCEDCANWAKAVKDDKDWRTDVKKGRSLIAEFSAAPTPLVEPVQTEKTFVKRVGDGYVRQADGSYAKPAVEPQGEPLVEPVQDVTLIERIEASRMKLTKAMRNAELDVDRPDKQFTGPFTGDIGFHDGIFVAVSDANGQRVANIYEITSAAELIQALNLGMATAVELPVVAWLLTPHDDPLGPLPKSLCFPEHHTSRPDFNKEERELTYLSDAQAAIAAQGAPDQAPVRWEDSQS